MVCDCSSHTASTGSLRPFAKPRLARESAVDKTRDTGVPHRKAWCRSCNAYHSVPCLGRTECAA
ncbi:MAG TPA: hypothetical protein VJJ47_02925 [Candidatus Paceibacterota bacterium]